MTTGNRTQVANSMIHSDIWLDDASHTVRLEFGSIEDGNRNGNRVKPNVSTTPATPIDEARKAARQERMPTSAAASNAPATRSEEHTSELQSLMRTSYAVFCLTKNNNTTNYIDNTITQ